MGEKRTALFGWRTCCSRVWPIFLECAMGTLLEAKRCPICIFLPTEVSPKTSCWLFMRKFEGSFCWLQEVDKSTSLWALILSMNASRSPLTVWKTRANGTFELRSAAEQRKRAEITCWMPRGRCKSGQSEGGSFACKQPECAKLPGLVDFLLLELYFWVNLYSVQISNLILY